MRIGPAFMLALLLSFPMSAAVGQERKVPKLPEQAALPVEIVSDRLSADSVKNSVAFEGNVVAKQGDVTLTSDRLSAEYSRESGVVEKIVAEGNVRLLQEGREARAARGVFFNLEQRIVLSGGAELVQGGNTLKGESVTVFLRENRSVVTGGEGGRVKAVIQPKGLQDLKPKGKQGQ